MEYRVSKSRNSPPSTEYWTDTSGNESSPMLSLMGVPDATTDPSAGLMRSMLGSTM